MLLMGNREALGLAVKRLSGQKPGSRVDDRRVKKA